MLTSLLPAFHAECSPAKYRGSIVLLDLVACACGLTLSFWLSFATSCQLSSWHPRERCAG
jgi:glutathione peroxidase-family protein